MADRVRLRLTGEAPPVELPIADDPPPIACIAIVGAHDGVDVEPMARALAEGRTVPRWRAILRSREGAETIAKDGETVVRASVSEIDAALDALGSETAIAIGSAFVARRRPRLAILITGGASPVQWVPAIRAIRDRFDLVLEEARPALARALAERLLDPEIERR